MRVIDCSKSKGRLGWQPLFDIKTALSKTVEWYKTYYDNGDVLKLTLSHIEDYEKLLMERKVFSHEL